MNNCYGIIYCALNTTNDKRYIGQTIRELNRRKKEHLYQAKNGSNFAFHQAIRKYGEDIFEWSIIDVANNQEELDEKELYWIDYYDTYNLGGYNMSVGGQFTKRTEDNADELSMMFGGREFYVFDLEGKFIKSAFSQTQFAKEIGVGVTTVNNILRGLKNSTKGFILIYKDEFSDEKLNNLLNKIHRWYMEFLVFDKNNNLVGKWDNKVDCSKDLNVSVRSIQRQLSEPKVADNARKYKFYYTENLPNTFELLTSNSEVSL